MNNIFSNLFKLTSFLLILVFASCTLASGNKGGEQIPPETTDSSGGNGGDKKPDNTLPAIETYVDGNFYFESNQNFKKSDINIIEVYSDGSKKSFSNFEITPAISGTQKMGKTDYTITYNSKTYPISVYKVDYQFTDTVTEITEPANASYSGGKYYKFGDYPVKKITDTTGYTFDTKSAPNGWYLGKDNSGKNNFYAKVGNDYYELEPIIWRQLTNDYDGKGNSLLLAESILEGGIPYYYDCYDTVYDIKQPSVPENETEALTKALSIDPNIRTIDSKKIFTNNYEYSQIRAFLNGLNYYKLNLDLDSSYRYNNFISKAFPTCSDKLIVATIKNDGVSGTDQHRSSIPGSDDMLQGIDATYDAHFNLTCNNTNDKVFLLSEYEITNGDYGFERGDGNNTSRQLKKTEYSISKTDNNENYMLRTPYYKNTNCIRYSQNGYPYQNTLLNNPTLGIVPDIVVKTN